jgi:hypothetical protein
MKTGINSDFVHFSVLGIQSSDLVRRPDHEQWHIRVVANLVNGAPDKQIGNQPITVRRHGD